MSGTKKPTKKPTETATEKKAKKAEIKRLEGIISDAAAIEKLVEVNKQVITDLASCVLWALKFLKVPSGAGMSFDPKTMISTPWQEKFMLALDGVGYSIDRKEFWKKDDKKKPRRRR